jgi:hypothetical protein
MVSKVTAAATYNALLRALAPVLAAYQFRRRGNRFAALKSDCYWVVGFQKSLRHSTSESLRFTINLGVLSRAIAELRHLDYNRDVPSDPDCHLRSRIGQLLDEPDDRWWIIDRETDLALLFSTHRDLLEERVFPYFEGIGSDRGLRELWLSGQSPGATEVERLRNLAVLLYVAGEQDALRGALDQLIRKSPGIGRALAEDLHVVWRKG